MARIAFAVAILIALLHPASRAMADATTAINGRWTVPVLEIRYFPVTADGKKVDINVTSNVGATLETIRGKCDRMTREAMTALSEGSRYHAYSHPAAKASLKYEVLASKEYLEP